MYKRLYKAHYLYIQTVLIVIKTTFFEEVCWAHEELNQNDYILLYFGNVIYLLMNVYPLF